MPFLKAEHEGGQNPNEEPLQYTVKKKPVVFTAALVLTSVRHYDNLGAQENISPITSHSCSRLFSFRCLADNA